MSREGKLAKNTLILSIGTFLPKLASFITLPILTGYLTHREMGTYDLIIIMESLFLPTVTFQIQTAAFRFLIDARGDSKKVKEIVTSITAFTVPISIAALLVLYVCLGEVDSTVRMLICLYFLTDQLVNVARQICRGLNDNMVYSISAILSSLGKMIFAVICVYWMRAGLLGTVIALFMSVLFSLIYLVFSARLYRYISPAAFSKDKLIEMLRYSWPMVPNCMSSWVMRVSDRLVVNFFMGVEAYAVYAVANKIPSLLNIAQNTFTMAWQENATVVSKDKDASEYYSSMFGVMFDLMAGFFGLLIAVTPILFKLLIRGDYGAAYFQIPILFMGMFFYSMSMFFYSMSMFLGGIYVAYKESKSVGVTTTAAAACNLVVDIATIRWIGLYAASGSTLVSYLFLFIFRSVDVQRIVKVRYNLRHVLVVTGIMTAESILCYQQSMALNLVNFALGCIVFAVLNKSFVRTVIAKGIAYLKKNEKVSGSRIQTEPSDLPDLASEKKSCCGCGACYDVCPAGAIEMQEDEEGFLYPQIDPDKCVRCRRCLQACTFKKDLND